MLKRFMPREEKFFDLFQVTSKLIHQAAEHLCSQVNNLDQAAVYEQKIKDLENQGDQNTHLIIHLLHKTFITPLDREEIHELAERLDDILDYMEAVSARISMYEVKTLPVAAAQLADRGLRCSKLLLEVMIQLENIKNPLEMAKNCVEIHNLENQADEILRTALADLFKNEPDIRQLLKAKEILELLEKITDLCESVANIVEGIVLEHS